MNQRFPFLKEIRCLKGNRSFFILIIGYFLIHLIFRLLLTNSLEVDEAEQVFLSQKILIGYNQQPPLYTWIIIVLTKLFGYNLISILILRTALLIGIFTLVFKISKEYQNGFLISTISTISLVLFFQLSIESLRQTHTVLVTFAVVFLVWSFIKLVHNQSILNYILFGIAMTLGMLSKYNFIISLLALLLAIISDTEYQKTIINKKIGISLLVFGVLILPHTIWLSKNILITGKETIDDLATQNISYIYTIIPSIWAMIKGVLSFGGVFFIAVFFLFKGKIKPVLKNRKVGSYIF